MKSTLVNCYELIHSMSKSDKKAVTVSLSKSSNNNQNLLLFKTLNNLKKLDESKLTVQLKKKKVSNYKIIIHSLYKKLLHILLEVEQQHNKSVALRTNLNYVYLLKDRNQYKSALSLLKSVEKEAIESQSYAILVEIIRLKRTLYLLNEYSLEEVLTCLEEEKENLLRLSAHNRIDVVRIELNQLVYLVDANLLTKIEQHRPFLEEISKAYPEDVIVKNYILNIELLGMKEKGERMHMLSLLKEIKLLYDQHPLYKEHNLLAYLRIVTNMAMFYSTCGQPKESLETWANYIKEQGNTKFFKQHQTFVLINVEIRLLSNYIKTGVENLFLQHYLEGQRGYSCNIEPSMQLYLFRYRALYHWFKGELDLALDYIFQINQQIEGEMIISIEVATTKIYEGLLQVELENYLLLPTIVRQLKYLLKKIDNKHYASRGHRSIVHWLNYIAKEAPINRKKLREVLEVYIQKYPDYINWEISPEIYFSLWVKSILLNKNIDFLVQKQQTKESEK